MNLREALDTPIAWFYRGKVRYPKGHKNEDLPVVYNGDRCGCTVWTDMEDELYIFTLEPPHTYKDWMKHPYLKYARGCVINKNSAKWGTVFYEDGVVKKFCNSGRNLPWVYVCNKPIETGEIRGCSAGHCEHPEHLEGFQFHNNNYGNGPSYTMSWVYPGSNNPRQITTTSQPEARLGLFTKIMPLVMRYCSQLDRKRINGVIPDVLIQDGETLIYIDPGRESGFVIPDMTCPSNYESCAASKYSISGRHSYYSNYANTPWYCDHDALFIGTAYWRTYVHSKYSNETKLRPVWVATGIDKLLSVETSYTDSVKHVLEKSNIKDFDAHDMLENSWLPRWIIGTITDCASSESGYCARAVDFSDHGLDALATFQLYNPTTNLEDPAKRFNKKQLVQINNRLKENDINALLNMSSDSLFNTNKLPQDIDFRALSDEVFKSVFLDNFDTIRRISHWYFTDCLNRICTLRPGVKRLANLQAMLEYFTKVFEAQGQNIRDWEAADYWQLLIDCKDLRGFDTAEYTVFPDVNRIDLLHNRLTRIRNDNRDEIARKQADELNIKFKSEMSKKKYLEFESDKYIMSLPTCTDDLQDEGALLHHCVGSYCGSVAEGRETIVFLRHKDAPDVPFLTVDVTPDGDIRQIHGKYNCNVDECHDKEDIWKFVENWCDEKKLNKKSLKGCGRVCCHL